MESDGVCMCVCEKEREREKQKVTVYKCVFICRDCPKLYSSDYKDSSNTKSFYGQL